MRRVIAMMVFAWGCAPARAPIPLPANSPDSIVLERTACFGICPVYRLSIARTGIVAFKEDSITARDKITAAEFARLNGELAHLGFDSLPDDLEAHREYCPSSHTDAPSTFVSVFRGTSSKTVRQYHGCRGGRAVVDQLRRFEDLMDSTAHAGRWIKPMRIR